MYHRGHFYIATAEPNFMLVHPSTAPHLDRSALPDMTDTQLEVVPLARSETIPSSWYTDSRVHTLDRHAVFECTWQYVGHVGQVSKPGSLFTADVGSNPVVIVRDKAGSLRAFYNVCRHRGGPLATEDCSVNMLQCKYHGWTYQLDGSLRGVPRFNRTELFDRKDYGLIPVQVACWEGLVFVNLSETQEPLDAVMTGIMERIAPIQLDTKRFHCRVNYEVHCNWKVYVDNYLEGYHLPYVHPELCNLLDVKAYTTETFEHYSLQFSPFSGGENVYQDEGGEAFYYFVFPNFMLNILPGRLQTNRVVPLAPDKTLVVFDYYYDDPTAEATQQVIRDDLAYSEVVQQEDIEICEYVQRGLNSRGYDRGRFSVECEAGVHHFQTLLKKAYRRALNEE